MVVAMCVCIAATTLALSTPVDAATAGTISGLSLTTQFTGADVPNAMVSTAQAAMGDLASNDLVGFEWTFVANDLTDGTFTQTLPVGWTWDTGSAGFTALDSTNSNYVSTYTVATNTSGESVLTADISTVGTGEVGITIPDVDASPGSSVANGSTYSPELSALDGSGTTQTSTTSTVTVVNQTESDVSIVGGGTATQTSSQFDFGDGNGAVAAYATSYTIAVSAPATGNNDDIGAANTTLSLPLEISDVLGPLPAGITTFNYALGSTSSLPTGDTASVSCTGTPATNCIITISGSTPLDLTSGPYDVSTNLLVPASQVPVSGSSSIASIANTVGAVVGTTSGFNDRRPGRRYVK